MKKTLIIFFVTLLFSSNGFSSEQINNIFNQIQKNHISNDEYIEIGKDFLFVIDIFEDFSVKCDWSLSVYGLIGWKEEFCISYRKKVLPFKEKIISIGEFINKRDIKSLTTTQYKEAIFFPIFFNNAFIRIQKPYKKFEVLN
jgi:hypothetical protein|tara:strand:- start:415 stop:840 length:426 start_codon:yes stop_codon:yes gene_type:complete